MFKKQPKNDATRGRQPIAQDRGSQTVFSYHANRSAREAGSPPTRNTKSVLWSGAPGKQSPRPPIKGRFRRLRTIAIAIVVAGVGVYGLILDRNPEIIPLADTGNRQVFLRKTEVYAQAARAVLAPLANTNKLTIDTEKISKDLRKQFPELEQVSVTLPVFGRRPAVYIQPAQPALLLKTTDGGVLVLDTSGRALMGASQVPRVEKLGLVVVEDQSGLPVALGAAALPSSNVAFIAEVIGQLKAKHITVTGMVLPKATSQLDVRVEGAPYMVKFNLQGDARAEVGAYLAVKQHLEREKKTPASYIDVRVDNRAYYQ